MKKILIYAVFLAFGLSLQAQTNLYVQFLDGYQQAFPLTHQPRITFEEQTMRVATTVATNTFALNELQNFSFTLRQGTGITVNPERPQITLFPNPVRDLLTLEVHEIPVEGLSFRLFDLNGRQLKTERLRSASTQIQMDRFPIGTYVISIVDSDGRSIQSFQIVKQ